MRGEVIDGKRICPSCKTDKLSDEYSPGNNICKRCKADRRTEWRRAHPDLIPTAPTVSRACDNCGVEFEANKRRKRYCSVECFEAYRNKANWKHVQRRRARQRAATVEDFDDTEIYQRDEWVCGICQHPIDANVKCPDAQSPSIDHIIPIARGGTHERGNVQAAHLGCNVHKGIKVGREAA
jgi:hypothetical protein